MKKKNKNTFGFTNKNYFNYDLKLSNKKDEIKLNKFVDFVYNKEKSFNAFEQEI